MENAAKQRLFQQGDVGGFVNEYDIITNTADVQIAEFGIDVNDGQTAATNVRVPDRTACRSDVDVNQTNVVAVGVEIEVRFD